MYAFEARFHCITNDAKLWYLGCQYGESEIPIDKMPTDAEFINQLFKHLFDVMAWNPKVDLKLYHNTHFFSTFFLNKNKIIINLCVGNIKPTYGIETIETRNGRYHYILARGSQFYDVQLILLLLNKYTQVCNSEEHRQVLNKTKSLSFSIFHHHPESKPCAISFLEDSRGPPTNPDQIKINVYVGDINYRVIVEKVLWEKRAFFQREDILKLE